MVPPGVIEGLELPFHSSRPGVLGSYSFPLLIRCPVKGCEVDFTWLSPHHMPSPSPSPSHDDGVHAVLGAADVNMLVRDGWRIFAGYFQGCWCGRWAAYWGRFQSPSSILSRSKVESTQLWYIISLVSVLNWDDFHTLFSIFETISDDAACSVIMPDSVIRRWIVQLLEDHLRSLWSARGLWHSASSLLPSSGWSSALLVMGRRVVFHCMVWWTCEPALGHRRNPILQLKKRVDLITRGRFDVVSHTLIWQASNDQNIDFKNQKIYAINHGIWPTCMLGDSVVVLRSTRPWVNPLAMIILRK